MTDEKVQELWDEYRKAKAAYTASYGKIASDLKKVFALSAKELFDANPDLVSFGWKQYVPSFNDGEPCRFSATTDYPYVNGRELYGEEDDYEDYDDDSDTPATVYPQMTKERHEQLCMLVANHLTQFSDDELEGAFGENASVYVQRDSIKVSSYYCGY